MNGSHDPLSPANGSIPSKDPRSVATGVAICGIRMPQIATPVATLRGSFDGIDPLAGLSGSCEPFTATTLRLLYPSQSDYIGQLDESIAAATNSGFLLERDAIRIRE